MTYEPLERYLDTANDYEVQQDYKNADKYWQLAEKLSNDPGFWQEAEKNLQDSSLGPDDRKTKRKIAFCKLAAGKYAQAAEIYQTLGQQNSTPRDLQRAGYCYKQVGNYDFAATCYRDAADITNDAADFRESARCCGLKVPPDHKSAAIRYNHAARLSHSAADWQDAAHCFELAVNHKDAAFCYEQAAKKSYGGGDKNNAALCWRRSGFHQEKLKINVDPINAQEYKKKYQEKHKKAAYCYNQAADITNFMDDWRDTAINNEKAGNFKQAAYCYNEAAKFSGFDTDWRLAGDCYAHKDVQRFMDAAFCYNQAADLTDSHNDLRLAAYYFAHKEFPDYKKASLLYDRAAKQSKRATDWLDAASCYAKIGDQQSEAFCLDQADIIYSESKRLHSQERDSSRNENKISPKLSDGRPSGQNTITCKRTFPKLFDKKPQVPEKKSKLEEQESDSLLPRQRPT